MEYLSFGQHNSYSSTRTFTNIGHSIFFFFAHKMEFYPICVSKDYSICSTKQVSFFQKGIPFVPQKGHSICPSKRVLHLSLKKAFLFVSQKDNTAYYIPPNDIPFVIKEFLALSIKRRSVSSIQHCHVCLTPRQFFI